MTTRLIALVASTGLLIVGCSSSDSGDDALSPDATPDITTPPTTDAALYDAAPDTQRSPIVDASLPPLHDAEAPKCEMCVIGSCAAQHSACKASRACNACLKNPAGCTDPEFAALMQCECTMCKRECKKECAVARDGGTDASSTDASDHG
jgi:hypothetical protein